MKVRYYALWADHTWTLHRLKLTCSNTLFLINPDEAVRQSLRHKHWSKPPLRLGYYDEC